MGFKFAGVVDVDADAESDAGICLDVSVTMPSI